MTAPLIIMQIVSYRAGDFRLIIPTNTEYFLQDPYERREFEGGKVVELMDYIQAILHDPFQ